MMKCDVPCMSARSVGEWRMLWGTMQCNLKVPALPIQEWSISLTSGIALQEMVA